MNKIGYEMDGILESIESQNMTEDQILEVKEKMKAIDKKLKKKNKPKTITISSYNHAIIKNYCNSLNLNIGDWVTKVLIEKIESDNCIIKDDFEDYDDYIEKESEKLEDKYKFITRDKLYKTDKMVVNKDFRFVSYSSADSRPIYETSGNKDDILDKYGINYEKPHRSEVGNGILYNIDLDMEILY